MLLEDDVYRDKRSGKLYRLIEEVKIDDGVYVVDAVLVVGIDGVKTAIFMSTFEDEFELHDVEEEL